MQWEKRYTNSLASKWRWTTTEKIHSIVEHIIFFKHRDKQSWSIYVFSTNKQIENLSLNRYRYHFCVNPCSEDYYGDLDLKSIRKSELLAGTTHNTNQPKSQPKPRPAQTAEKDA